MELLKRFDRVQCWFSRINSTKSQNSAFKLNTKILVLLFTMIGIFIIHQKVKSVPFLKATYSYFCPGWGAIVYTSDYFDVFFFAGESGEGFNYTKSCLTPPEFIGPCNCGICVRSKISIWWQHNPNFNFSLEYDNNIFAIVNQDAIINVFELSSGRCIVNNHSLTINKKYQLENIQQNLHYIIVFQTSNQIHQFPFFISNNQLFQGGK